MENKVISYNNAKGQLSVYTSSEVKGLMLVADSEFNWNIVIGRFHQFSKEFGDSSIEKIFHIVYRWNYLTLKDLKWQHTESLAKDIIRNITKNNETEYDSYILKKWADSKAV